MLGKDGHGQPPAHRGPGIEKPMLGKDGHGQPPAHRGPGIEKPMLGKDGHGQPPAHRGPGIEKPMLGKDGHRQPPAHRGPGIEKPMLGKDGHGQSPMPARAGRPHGKMRRARASRLEHVPARRPQVSPEDAAAWYNSHTSLTGKDTAHLGSSVAVAAQCLSKLGGRLDRESWMPSWGRRQQNQMPDQSQCQQAADKWVTMATRGAAVAAQAAQVDELRAEQTRTARDAWGVDILVGNWGLQGVGEPDEMPPPPSGMWGDDDHPHFGRWGDDDDRRHDDDGVSALLMLVLLPVLLCFGVRRCVRHKRRRAAMALAGEGAGMVPPPPARFAHGPTPQQAAAAAANSAAAAPVVHYPFAVPPQAPAAPQHVQASLYPDLDQSSWGVSSWFAGRPSAPTYAPVSVNET